MKAAVLILIFLAAMRAGAFDLAKLPANTWVEVQPKYIGAPDGGQIFPMGWNNKGAYDPATRRVLVMDRWYDKIRTDTIYANAVLAFDPATLTCTVVKISNWKKEGNAGGGYATVALPQNAQDPTPLDRHPLGSVALSPDCNALLLVNGLNQSGPSGHPNDSWSLDLAKRSWKQLGAGGGSKQHPPHLVCDVMTYDIENKVAVLFATRNQQTQTWFIHPATGEWKAPPADPSAKGVAVQASGIAYDSKRKVVVCFGGGNQFDSSSGALWAYSAGKNKWQRLKDCPVSANAPGFDYDSKNDVYLAAIAGATWAYQPESSAWSEVAKEGLPASPWKSITYDPAHDVFVYQGGTWDKPVWSLLRHQPVPGGKR